MTSPSASRVIPGPGQESVWHAGIVIADSVRGLRVLETRHPPGWYVPPEDARLDLLTQTAHTTVCEWKGAAVYWTLRVASRDVVDAAWSRTYGGWITSEIVGPFKGEPGTHGW